MTWLALPAVSLFAIGQSLVRAAHATGPMLFGDETVYLLMGRFLSGTGAKPIFFRDSFYHFGYSTLLVPSYQVVGSPHAAYVWGLVVNALLCGLLVFLIYRLVRTLTGASQSAAVTAAAASALYPPLLLNTGIVWAENLLAPLFVLLFIVGTAFLTRPTLPRGVALAATGAFSYAVHPRALGVTIVVAAAFLAVAVARRLSVRSSVTLLMVHLGLLAAVWAGLHGLRSDLWVALSERQSISDFVVGALNPGHWPSMVRVAVGQAWYMSVATFGLAPIAVAWLARRRAAKGFSRPALFLLVNVLVLFATSVVFISTQVSRADQTVYGRYNDAFVAVLIALGLLAVIQSPDSLRQLLPGAGFTIGTAGLTWLAWRGFPTADLPMNPLNVLAIQPLVGPGSGVPLVEATAVSLAVTLLIAAATRWRRRVYLPVIPVFVAFLIGTGVTALWMNEANRAVNATITMQNVFDRIGHVPELAYDVTAFSAPGFYEYQFWLDETRLALYQGSLRLPPPALFAITKQEPGGTLPTGYRMVYPETMLDQALWVGPGTTQEQLERDGYLLPASPTAALPREAYRSSMRIVADEHSAAIIRAKPGEVMTLRVLISHEGRGSPWRPYGTLARFDSGYVRLVARWYEDGIEVFPDAFGIADLPHTVMPGDSVSTTLRIRVPPEATLAAYSLRLELIQQGVTTFSAMGDDALVLTVEITRSEQ